jgi:hypothetical protein
MPNYYGPKIATDGLVCYLDANNTKCYPRSGTTVTDLSGTVGNFTGNASYINPDTGFVSGASWSCGSTNILNTDTHSIFFRIRFNPSGTYPSGCSGNWDKLFSYNAGGGDRSPGIWRYPSSRWIHWRYNPSNSGCDFGVNGTTLDANSEFPLNTWYYVGVTKNGANTVMYVNSNRVGTSTVSNPKTSGNAAITLFESYTNPLCNIDQIKIYNRVISDDEVLQNYNSIKTRIGTP